jgi:hypothetical protein
MDFVISGLCKAIDSTLCNELVMFEKLVLFSTKYLLTTIGFVEIAPCRVSQASNGQDQLKRCRYPRCGSTDEIIRRMWLCRLSKFVKQNQLLRVIEWVFNKRMVLYPIVSPFR